MGLKTDEKVINKLVIDTIRLKEIEVWTFELYEINRFVQLQMITQLFRPDNAELQLILGKTVKQNIQEDYRLVCLKWDTEGCILLG